MKKKKLEWFLSELKQFSYPKLEFEQYATGATVASDILYRAFADGDVEGRSVLDLGCGCGTFLLGAQFLGATYSLGIEADPDALEICQENLKDCIDEDEGGCLFAPLDIVQGDVTKLDMKRMLGCFDTVIMNPPFGTRNPGMDVKFVEAAFEVCPKVIYTLHKTSTRKHVIKAASRACEGSKVSVLGTFKFDLPPTYKFHKVKGAGVDIEVDLIRIKCS